MEITVWIIIFIFGTIVGSFLNSVIYRLRSPATSTLPGNVMTFLGNRSFCPKCRHKLGFFDLIPIFSFIFLKRKCRYCSEKISWQYPIVEISTGLIFLLIFNFQFSIFNFVYLLIISCFLIIIFVYDLKHYLIPDKVIYPAILVSSIWYLVSSIFLNSYTLYMILNSLYSAIGAAAFFFLIWLVSRGKWMGFGDVKLAFFIGLFLGFPNILVGLFSAFFIGAIMGLELVIFGKKTLKSQVPFGPFLVIGTFIALFWGREIINWYLNLL